MTVLAVTDTMYFGKHKGQVVGKMILEDAGYACWLRDERKKTDPRSPVFNHHTNCLIDGEIKKSRTLAKKFAPWNLPPGHAAEFDAAAAKQTLTIEVVDVKAEAETNETVADYLESQFQARRAKAARYEEKFGEVW